MPHLPHFSQFFQLINTPSVLLLPDSPKFTIAAVNKAYLEAANSSEKDLIGKGVFEAFPENSEDSISKGVENLRNSLDFVNDFKEKHKMPPQKYDIPIRGTSEFKVKYFNSQNIPLLDDEGNITHIVHSVEDITDKKQMELSLETERRRFNDLYFQAPSCMGIIKGPDHVYEMANPLYLDLIGVKDVLGKSVKEILPELEAQGILAILDAVFETGETYLANEMLVKFDHHGNGELVDTYLDFNYQANRNNEGAIIGILFFASNVTELVLARKKTEESEKKYGQIVETAQEGIWLIDENNKITFVNNKLCEILGYTRDEMIGKDIYFFMDEDAKQRAVHIMKRKKEGNTAQSQFKYISKSGKEVWTHISANPHFDESGIYKGGLAMLTDITERKNTDEKLEKLNKELVYQNGEKEKRADELILANIELEFQNGEKENRAVELNLSNSKLVKTNKELDRFVYSVSHDLRSPLTSILGLISFIEEDSREPDTLEQVRMIRSSINRLDGFIKNILSYSQNNRTGLETQKIPIKKTIHEIVDSVRNIKESKGISFEINIDEQKPFYSDWQRFNTILENLISNAIKYHSEEVQGRYLKLTGTVDKDELNLSISDNGVGIDPEFHDKIFDMFYRLPGTTNGSGFGLYIVKETLEKMQGTIEVQSEKGVGTTFNIKLKNLKV